MENARKYVPSPSEFKKPIGTGGNKRPNHLRLVETQPAVEKFNIATAPTLESKLRPPIRELGPSVPTEEEIITPPDEIDLELEKLTTWPPHPNLELATSIIIEKKVAESALRYEKLHENDEPTENNHPNKEILFNHINKLEEKISSLEDALKLIIEPALMEADDISNFIKHTENKLANYNPEEKNGQQPKASQAIDQALQSRSRLYLKNRYNNTVVGQKGKDLNYFLDTEIHNKKMDIHDLKTEQLKINKTQAREPLQAVKPITQPQLQSIDRQRSGSSLGNKITDTFKKISSFFKKAA